MAALSRSTIRHGSHAVAASLLSIVAALAAPSISRADGDEHYAGEFQIQLQPGVSIEAINERYGTTTLDSLPPLYLLQVPSGGLEDDYISELRNDADVADVEYSWENQTPEGTRQMVVAAVGGTIDDYLDQNLTQRIHLAEIQAHARGAGVLIAVLDTGVLYNHPALTGAIAPGGWDYVDNDADPVDAGLGADEDGDGLIDEGAGHGTMVAGIIHLVAPDAQILPIRVLDDEGRGTSFAIAKGIRYAAAHGASIINMSLGMASRSMAIAYELAAAAGSQSVSTIAAAGNSGVEAPSLYPAADSLALSVAALDSSDVKADFSTWHAEIAVSAPGVGIMAPYYDGAYAIGAGTSFAAPFISAQCALVLSVNPGLNRQDVYNAVREATSDIYSIPANLPYDEKLGTGRLDGNRTVQVLFGSSAIGEMRANSGPFRLQVVPNPAPVGRGALLRIPDFSEARGVCVDIHDATGRVVRRIQAPRAVSDIRWDGLDTAGRPAPAGTYFIRVVRASRTARAVPEAKGKVTLLPQ